MTQAEQTRAAKEFSERWAGKGNEKQEAQSFWIDLLQNVLGVEIPTKHIEFEKPVKRQSLRIVNYFPTESRETSSELEGKNLSEDIHTNFIDAYIAGTKVLVEQKGADIDLHKAYKQSDGALLTPFQQAKRYADEMPNSMRPRWIVACNFSEFLIYDLELPNGEPQQIFLKDLPKEYYRLQFLVDQKNENIRREEELSVEAGRLVNRLYDALYKEFIPPAGAVPTGGNTRGLSENQLRSLNILCVRIVFCLYAEDAGLFDTRTAFEDYIKGFNLPNVRMGLM
ncbi:MAG: hypothetical protein IJL80_15505, partial [Treponema sp.]|nr:hypothetical protein [Treponema sp.]